MKGAFCCQVPELYNIILRIETEYLPLLFRIIAIFSPVVVSTMCPRNRENYCQLKLPANITWRE